MDKVALLPAGDRAALFGETAAARGVADTIIEKDFWVCWTLMRLFALQKEDAPTLVFKGGTSWSKAFGATGRGLTRRGRQEARCRQPMGLRATNFARRSSNLRVDRSHAVR